ncbi:ABC-2 type transport system ATP-binding protein [Flavobacterium succinicans]|jgi:ABC-2 type transport system ATP-binding protein|uniref:ABC-2 type transport system ATP-binding protein n=1 Tax=Flavobacterium succinicans TaxID=29536 RepID=A0A1I4UAZ2_9FLAO|nr:ABC-2 type transport system ATP-binding protein [Flavobacterium succinicans]
MSNKYCIESSYNKLKITHLETILSINNLNKRYGKIQALKNVSFEIKKGNVYGILGPNGSGKSTTLGITLNVVNASSGNYQWFDGTTETHEALKKVGAIIERPNFYPYMTAHENLKLVCKIKNINYSKIEEKLELVGLIERKDSKFSTFSLGMKQRLAIASALLNDPEILILDEPTNGLDPQGIHQIRDIIKKIAALGTTILLASHLLDEVEKVCSHVVVLQKGEILYAGPVDGIAANEGFFELEADDNQALKAMLQTHPAVEKVVDEDAKILVYLKSEWPASDLNRYLFDNQITLKHLVKRKNSLEEQFLTLTKK